MPERNPMLSAAQKAAVEAWVADKFKDSACPLCGNKTWVLAPDIVELPPFGLTIFDKKVSAYPHVMMTCDNCAYSMLFNAVMCGIVSLPKLEQRPQTTERSGGN